jgi:hypothetical protein
MSGRPLLASEAKIPMLERRLVIGLWGFKRLGRYCYYLPQVEMMLPDPAEVVMMNSGLMKS